MQGDIVNRVKRLPKPGSSSSALQPLFEAVSNALHAVENKFKEQVIEEGRLHIDISDPGDYDKIKIIVTDNGVGVDDARFGAFCTTDTDFKGAQGKGIGRLLWLDAFQSISVVSVFERDGQTQKRSFTFRLQKADQISDEKEEPVTGAKTGTTVTFRGIRTPYRGTFPVQRAVIIRHFGSHFLADFIMRKSPPIELTIKNETTSFPEAITSLLVEDRGTSNLETELYGELALASFICKKVASASFEGSHQLHFVANGRTVLSRKIDGLLGIGAFGVDGGNVYHGCVSGVFLDERVNQERTNFNFGEDILEDISKECAASIRGGPLKTEIEEFDNQRLVDLGHFLHEYPSFKFEAPEALLRRMPRNATKSEQFAQALVPTRIRRDNDRRETIQSIISTLTSSAAVPDNFAESVRKAADDVQAEEQRQLTEYIMRRKMVLDVLGVLINRLRETKSGKEDYQLENTLHQFICPMKIRGDDPSKVQAADHDLWIIDERLAFTRYFASDVPFTQLFANSANDDRTDLLIFDKIHGLGLKGEEPLSRLILVEFKKPGRKTYEENYSPLNQISRYLSEIVSGNIESYEGARVRVTNDCVCYCYVIADIVGALDIHTSGWKTTANGRGRWIELSGKYRGSIEVIEWRDLLKDARMRNAAFLHAAGVAVDHSIT